MPNLYIIAGCNGAGKTTASFTILPEILNCKEFVNADEIARGLSPFQPENVSFQAARLMIERINELLEISADFAFETTLTTLSYKNTLELAKLKGYTITLLYFWLNNINLAVERVNKRVSEGGHSIEETIIKRRYFRGMKNLIKIFINLCDYWIVVDNSKKQFNFIAQGQTSNIKEVYDHIAWEQINSLTHDYQ